jgi:hypothetical protein
VRRVTPDLEMNASLDPRIRMLSELRNGRAADRPPARTLARRAERRREMRWPTWQTDRSWPEPLLPLVRTHVEPDEPGNVPRPHSALVWGAVFLAIFALLLALLALGAAFGLL